MTKWICKSKCCSGRCTCDILPSYVPHRCLVDTIGSGWEMAERDCTTDEKKIDIEEMDERTARFRAYISKRLDALDKKDQELERELKNHYHETGFPK